MEIRRANESDICWIADHLKESDRREIWASHRKTPEDLPESCRNVDVWVAVAEHPVCIFGCNEEAGAGIPWLLATDEIAHFKIEFLRTSRAICHAWLQKHKLLTNLVHAENDLCILWLQWLGFSFPAVTMINGEKFLRFEKRWQNV